ncbi:MAG: glycosyltransferase family 2 protein [Proteobacteria bacterium]|nr:glycosyltransferase family 2 protein [Pseudomonadota bacterium]
MISIVIPLFNEEESLKPLYERLIGVFQDNVEFIFVDDGSTDRSLQILEDLSKKDTRVKVISFRRNFGKSSALSAGFKKASGDIIVTMDADLQDQPEEVPKLIEKLKEGYDLVIGWKYPRKDPISKRLPSKVINSITGFFTGLKIHDMNSGLKVMRKDVIQEVAMYGELHRYMPHLAHMKGFKVTEVKVKHSERKFGKSKFGAKRFLAGIFDLLTIIFLGKFGKKPLHFFGLFGLILFLIGLCINIYIAYLRFRYSSILGRLPLLLLGILNMIIGIQFISMGLIGELLTSFYVKEREYSVKRELNFDNSQA